MDNQAIKNYYRKIEDYDWTYAADNFVGPETLLHRLRERALLTLIKTYGKGSCLDVGCGTGLMLRHLPENSIGIDLNPRNIEKAKIYSPASVLIQGDIEEKLPFNDNSFLTVICTEVLEHLLFPDKTLKEIQRVLAPGGYFIGSMPSNSVIWKLRAMSFSKKHFEEEPYHKHRDKNEVFDLLQPFFQQVKIYARCFGMNWFFVARN
jgi:SAM-dependent methyltransferase